MNRDQLLSTARTETLYAQIVLCSIESTVKSIKDHGARALAQSAYLLDNVARLESSLERLHDLARKIKFEEGLIRRVEYRGHRIDQVSEDTYLIIRNDYAFTYEKSMWGAYLAVDALIANRGEVYHG